MTHVQINHSNIESIGYDLATKKMQVRFIEGSKPHLRLFEYPNISRTMVTELIFGKPHLTIGERFAILKHECNYFGNFTAIPEARP